jgi:multiple sugar transport system permease protein
MDHRDAGDRRRVCAVRAGAELIVPRAGRAFAQTGLYAAAGVGLLALMWPIAWMVSTSFKPADEIFANPPTWIPQSPTLDGYRAALSGRILRNFLNSVIIGAGATVVSVGAGAMMAYGVSRLSFRGKRAVMLGVLATLGIPIPLLMISLYVLFARTGILNTYPAVILGHAAITLPVVVWLLKDFFDTIPVELEEAAFIDGAGPFYTLFRIVSPLTRPGLAAAAIFVFVTSWNEFIFGLTYMSASEMRPLPAGITDMFLNEFQYRWGDTMAVAIIVTLPVMALFLLFQRHFIQGVTAGAVKG